ncbi:MAG TPA: DUF2784 domain-containing protein [Nitrospiraceae bacterium]|jgi:hypothetical protein|nr:DUF2784 domain-containing protein [Nitrospiraceae bacterium]
MGYRILADMTVLLHVLFVLFVVAGGLLAFRWRAIVWWHLPAALWAALIEFTGWICPLTPLENWLLTRSGQPTYDSDFIQHYMIPVLYPASLTRTVQIILGSAVLAVNSLIYIFLWRGIRAGRSDVAPPRMTRPKR